MLAPLDSGYRRTPTTGRTAMLDEDILEDYDRESDAWSWGIGAGG